MIKTVPIIFIIFVLGVGWSSSHASELSDKAAAMSPGTFVELSTIGLDDGFMKTGCSSPITSFTDSAVWDSVGRTFKIVGGPHGCPHSFASYSEATNTWTKLQPYSTVATHAYDHNTIDEASRTYYFRKHSSGGIQAYNLTTNAWTVEAVPTPSGSPQVSGAGLRFFPEMDTLVHFGWSGNDEVHIFENGGWTNVNNDRNNIDFGRRDAFSEYNPIHGHILFGGGYDGSGPNRREIFTLNSDRSISIKDVSKVPTGFGTHNTIVTLDPVSGKYLVFNNSKVFYEYDAVNDSWKTMGNVTVPFFDTHYIASQPITATVAAPVTNYGVVMFLQHLNGNPKAWLYKHQDSGPPDTTPPTMPSNLSGSALNQSQISLSWTAATDADSGVTGYNIYRDGIVVGSSFENSYTDSGLVDNTSYSYRVSAVNFSGLEGAQSATVMVSTLADNLSPTLVSASASGDANQVLLYFNEPLAQTSAETASNYTISNSISVSSASLNPDEQTVLLTTSTLSEGITYSATVNGISDQATSPNTIAANSQTSFEFIPSLAGSSTMPATYIWSVLTQGAAVYVDRPFTFGAIPAAYQGLDYLQTANNDKGSSGTSFITFDVSRDVRVYVGHDVRVNRPSWLASWADTGDAITSNDTTFDIYAKDFASGSVTLGGNEGANGSMYTVLVGPSAGGPIDSQPIANADSAITTVETSVDISVLNNDSGLADTPVSVSIVSQPNNGSASVVSNAVRYVPENGFVGQDSLTYRVSDNDGDFSSATLTITVSGSDNGVVPLAQDDFRSLPQNTLADINVLANDANLDDLPITVSIVAAPESGLATVINGNVLRYNPNVDFVGVDTMAYQAMDADGDSSEATVTLVVFSDNGANDTPIALTDNEATDENTAINIDVLLNDFGLDDAPISVTITAQPSNGGVAVETDNTVTYTPNIGFNGVDSFAYQITDDDGETSQAVVNVTVGSGNTVDTTPQLVSDSISTSEDQAVTVLVMANDLGLDDLPMTLSISGPAANGTAIVNGDQSITYTPNSGFTGVDVVTYQVIDIDGDSDSATLTITVNAVGESGSDSSGGGAGNPWSVGFLFLLFMLAYCRGKYKRLFAFAGDLR